MSSINTKIIHNYRKMFWEQSPDLSHLVRDEKTSDAASDINDNLNQNASSWLKIGETVFWTIFRLKMSKRGNLSFPSDIPNKMKRSEYELTLPPELWMEIVEICGFEEQKNLSETNIQLKVFCQKLLSTQCLAIHFERCSTEGFPVIQRCYKKIIFSGWQNDLDLATLKRSLESSFKSCREIRITNCVHPFAQVNPLLFLKVISAFDSVNEFVQTNAKIMARKATSLKKAALATKPV